MMLSERGIALLNENSPSTEGVKISELEPVDELYNGCCFPIVQNGETKKIYFDVLRDVLRQEIIGSFELSDIETLTLSTTDTVMPYDGFISAMWYSSSGFAGRCLYINDIRVGVESSVISNYTNSGTVTWLVKKGDRVRIKSNGAYSVAVARWWKNK